jgi:hypothetical protein
MIFITGDTHGDFSRFTKRKFPIQNELSKDDYVIICGDFGVWDNSREQKFIFDELNARSFTTLFVDGNHENFDMLSGMHVHEWHGGDVHYIRDSVIHLMRGQIFDIGEKSFFTMGGAQSHDIEDGILELDDPNLAEKRHALHRRRGRYRINHRTWWKEELPSDEEYRIALRNLAAHENKVDYMITHCCPTGILYYISAIDHDSDALTDFFDVLKDKIEFKKWFFGHYHGYASIDAKFQLLYEDIILQDEYT